MPKHITDNQFGLSVSQFGAVGDGVTDDTQAVKDAIVAGAAQKLPVYFDSGKAYLITSQIQIMAQSTLIGHPSHRPIIRVKSQTFDPIRVEGSSVGSTTLTSNATVNTKWIDVADASLIKPSQLLEIVSSLSWYHDPREDSSDCRKAELHRVDEIIGNRVYLTDPLMDGYDLSKETVAINFYTPIRFHMEDIEIVMDRGAEPNDNIRRTGIQLRYTIDSTLKNVYVTNAVNCGISLYHSYRPTVDGGRTTGANNYFAGYGVQTYGTTHAVIKNRHSRNCRRSVDISGGTIPSHYSIIEGCSAFGNGLNSLLNRYTYNDDHTAGTYAGGFGTHGGADHTIIRNNYMGFLHAGIIDRSRNTIVENNYFVGDFYTCCIDVSFGTNGTIRGNQVYDGFTGYKERLISDGGANYNTRKAPIFIRYQSTAVDTGASGGFFRVEDNMAMVSESFIELYASNDVTTVNGINNFIVKGNHVIFTPQYTSGHCAFIKKTMNGVPFNIIMSESTFKDNTFKRSDGVGNMYYFDGVDPRNRAQIDSPKTYSFYMPDDTAEYVHVGGNQSLYMVVMVTCSGGGAILRLSKNITGEVVMGYNNNCAGQGVALTGTTGVDGKLSLAYTDDGKLYVENRLGSTQRIAVTVLNYL